MSFSPKRHAHQLSGDEVDYFYENFGMARVLTPGAFDELLAEGWRYLSKTFIRHSFYNGLLTVPTRIDLAGFEFTSGQRKALRRGKKEFRIEKHPIVITPAHEELFFWHTFRLAKNVPSSLHEFVSYRSFREPYDGYQFDIYYLDQLVATSFFHEGNIALSGTYCVFSPFFQKLGLGTFTFLLEIELAIALGKTYYYAGYMHNIPSQFDYKLNFNNAELLDWKDFRWHPAERILPKAKNR
jgi:leucyl-tRNA---protein transferase